MGKRVISVANIIEDGRIGGPQIRIVEVAKALLRDQRSEAIAEFDITDNDKCIETTVIFPKYDSYDFQKKLESYEIPFIRLPLHRPSKSWKYLLQYMLWFPLEILILQTVLKKNQFDLVHVSGGSWQIKGAIAGKLAGCRVLWHLNDTKIPGIIRAFFGPVAGLCASGFIVAGQRVKNYYLEDSKLGVRKPVFEIQAPVDCNYFDPQNINPDESISEIEAIKIASVGNVSPIKGFEYFLSMAEILSKKNKDLHFFIVGPHWKSQQNYSKKLEQIKTAKGLHNLTFYGSSLDVRKIYKATDIYVCTSVAEASPNAVWEAMAMQKPIVATDVGDISRFLTHGENAYIVPSGDSEELAYYVGKLAQDPKLREHFGKKARLKALENLDISKVAKQHFEVYRGIFKNK